jgi:hypothetical protein
MGKSKLEQEFDLAMMEIYLRARSEAAYTASIFHGMLSKMGGLATARQLINDTKESQGYTALWERGRLDLTVEAVVHDNPKWHLLFDPSELENARKRLDKYGYFKQRP